MSEKSDARRLVAGNWKMNLRYAEGAALVHQCVNHLGGPAIDVVFCAPAIHLKAIDDAVQDMPKVHVGAQDVSAHEGGAHTGELSASQLASVGCSYVIVGHSERRKDHGEGGSLLAKKVDQALAHELRPIYCFGETLDQRQAEQQEGVVASQLEEGLAHLSAEQWPHVVLAYEPVWAIGTGATASPAQAQSMHAFIREWVKTRFGESLAEQTTILYGGSVKPTNAAELFGQPDIDGGLIGGASLKANDFVAIIEAA